MKYVLRTLAALVVIGGATVLLIVFAGLYDISATDQHLPPTYRMLDIAMRESVKLRSSDIEAPALDDPALRARGLSLYAEHCSQCHGAPGVAPEPFALGLKPLAANLAYTARHWAPRELFWVIKHGIKMTAMPAWDFRISDEEMWAVVAFVETLPDLTPADYRERLANLEPAAGTQDALPPANASRSAAVEGDVERGRQAMLQYACVTCHHIPGVVGPDAPVGPPLDHMASRAFIAGLLPNEREHMIRWLRAPQNVNPDTTMPDLGVTERDARDMAAFLATLR